MALTDDRRASLMAYCRIDTLEEGVELLLQTLDDAAGSYMTGAGVTEPEPGTLRRAQYDLCINFMVLRDYDLRDAIITGGAVVDNPAFRGLITQLKLTEPVSDLDT